MEYHAGIDVSLEASSAFASSMRAATSFGKRKSQANRKTGLAGSGILDLKMTRIGLEAGPLSQWLYAAMKEEGLAVELLETRHVHDAFKAMPVKSDRNRHRSRICAVDAFRAGSGPVHCKSMPAQEVRALLTARKLVQSKLFDIE